VAAIENAIKTLPPFTTIVGATSSSIQVISHSVALNAHAPHRVRRERGTVVRAPGIRSQHTCPLLHLPPVVARYETHACIHSSPPHAPAARARRPGRCKWTQSWWRQGGSAAAAPKGQSCWGGSPTLSSRAFRSATGGWVFQVVNSKWAFQVDGSVNRPAGTDWEQSGSSIGMIDLDD
jgi:hypothetical protein